MKYTVGIDEAGRGPWAGPVVAGAVILDPQKEILGLNDSKKLSEKKRLQLSDEIKDKALAWGIGRADASEIDQLNILQATFLAMQRAIDALTISASFALVDGHLIPPLTIPASAIIKGDSSEPCISAASIIAKVTRDQEMQALAQTYPGYGFEKHKGYGTKVHQEALIALGACDIHRRSFKPVAARLINNDKSQ